MNSGARGVPENTADPVPGVGGVPPVKVLYIGGFGRSGSTLVERILGQIPGFCSAGEVVFIWQRGLVENQLCGCGAAFSDCDFWTRVGKTAFGGWDHVDGAEMVALQHQVDRNRYIPAMVAPRLRPGAVAAFERYTDALSRLYRGIREVSGDRVVIDASKHASTAYLLRKVRGLDLRVVHLVRDARGVAYSWTKEVKRPEVADGYMPVYRPSSSGLQWLTYNLLFDAFGVLDDSLVLCYEAALADPRGTVERILAHAGEHRGADDLSFLKDGPGVRGVPERWVELGVDHTVAGNPMR
ncbi:MAG: sulfotransferase, partial [Actinomycetota bacterium]|nr:sulfotransferase [Actinomycetota bacterium]